MLTVDEVVERLQKLIYHIAHNKASDDSILMTFDELVGELSFELVKTFKYYQDRKDMTDGQLLAVIRRSLDNRVSELIYRHFTTHRKLGLYAEDIDSMYDGGDDDLGEWRVNVNSIVVQASIHADTSLIESRERVAALYSTLSPIACKIVDEILSGNDLISMNMQLSVERAATVYKSQTTNVKMQPWHIADSLGLDVEQVIAAFKEIRQKYAEVCNDKILA